MYYLLVAVRRAELNRAGELLGDGRMVGPDGDLIGLHRPGRLLMRGVNRDGVPTTYRVIRRFAEAREWGVVPT